MKDLIISFEEKRAALEECIEEYSSPIFIVGLMSDLDENQSITTLSATIPREELIIKNNRYPEWLTKVVNNSLKNENILFIKDFEDISEEEQKLFIDIICENCISSEELPENLKVIINSEYECPIIPEIREVVQYFKF